MALPTSFASAKGHGGAASSKVATGGKHKGKHKHKHHHKGAGKHAGGKHKKGA